MRTTHYLYVPERLYYMSPEKKNVLRLVSDDNNHYLLSFPEILDPCKSASHPDVFLQRISTNDPKQYYHGKAVTFSSPEYRETETEFFLTEEGGRDTFLHYQDGKLSAYDSDEYLVSDGILYKRHIRPTSDTEYAFDVTLTNMQSQEIVALCCYQGEDIFSYQGSWYEFWCGKEHARAIDLRKKDLDISRDSSVIVVGDILLEFTIDDPIAIHYPPPPKRVECLEEW